MNNSLVSRMFLALARRDVPQARPIHGSEMKTEQVMAESRLCGHCWFYGQVDIVKFSNRITWSICRRCGCVDENGTPSGYVMLDNGQLEAL